MMLMMILEARRKMSIFQLQDSTPGEITVTQNRIKGNMSAMTTSKPTGYITRASFSVAKVRASICYSV